jgi:cellulose synthase operon protein C
MLMRCEFPGRNTASMFLVAIGLLITGTPLSANDVVPTDGAVRLFGTNGKSSEEKKPSAPRREYVADVDESALRYFAAQGDIKRMQAEIARLKSLYPTWQPPRSVEELLSQSDLEIRYLWDMYAEGDYLGVREAIADREKSEPGWESPQALIEALDVAEARHRMANAASAGQWKTVLGIADDRPQLLVCAEMSSLWNVGEAFARTKQTQRALDLYTYILTNCSDPGERVGTVQKANELLSVEMVADLMKLERSGPDGEGEFEVVRADMLRGRIGAAAKDTSIVVSDEVLTKLEEFARERQLAGDAELLGFYYFGHDSTAKAVSWFETALEWGGEAKAAEGSVLALARSGEIEKAIEIGRKWRDAAPENAHAYVSVMTGKLTADPPAQIDAGTIGDFASFVVSKRASIGALGLGYYALNTGQTDIAAQWFQAAIGWEPDMEDAAFGLAISYQRQKNFKALEDLRAQWASRSHRIAEFAESATRQARAASSAGVSVSAQSCRKSQPAPASLSAPSALAFGWCLMELERPYDAAVYFERAMSGDSKTASEAGYGAALAYLRKGMTTEAASVLRRASLTSKRASEIQTAILSQQAVNAFDQRQYEQTLALLDQRGAFAPENIDLMVIRGWAYYQLGRMASAEKVFRRVLQTGRNRQAAEGLNAVLERTGKIIPGG